MIDCNDCFLFTRRRSVVYGEGNTTAKIMLIGEAPGYYEDKLGAPFVGSSGGLIDEVLSSLNDYRSDLYITNIVKCRPPNNRVPTNTEISACSKHLYNEIFLVKPKVIILLGNTATSVMLNTDEQLSRIINKPQVRNNTIWLPTYHPSYILRNKTNTELYEKFTKTFKIALYYISI